ncbi:MAG: aldehyde dehydrogenase family protein [Candidatus Hydrogenedentota bacterium]
MSTLTEAVSSGIRVSNPRTGEQLYDITEPTPEDVDRVYRQARAAADILRAMSPQDRCQEAEKLKQYLLDNRFPIAERIVAETGKTMTDALMMEVFPAIDTIDYYQKHAPRILADRKVKTPPVLFGKKSQIFYEPMGVVLVIAPWNYPFHLAFIPSICAWFAGNAIILKPSRLTPLQGLTEEMVQKSGFMPDALQVVYATRKTAGHLIEARPDKIHFTGSVDAGKKIMAQAASHLIPVELELGGKDPMIVFGDVDLDRATNGALWGSMANSGQTCTSIERIFVERPLYADFLRELTRKAERLRQADAHTPRNDDGAIDVGCMTADFQIREIEEQLEEARTRGAAIETGGARPPETHFLPPTIVTNTTRDMQIQYHESFGPVVTVTPFDTEDDAVTMANDSPYGLASSVWSTDRDRAVRVARRLVTGNVSINNVLATQGNPALPFGGLKDSGFGRYRGDDGLYTFCNVKSVISERMSKRAEPYWFPFSATKLHLLNRLIEVLFRGGPLRILKLLPIALKLDRLNAKNKL